MGIPLGIHPGTYPVQHLHLPCGKRDGTHHFSEDTKLGCAGDPCEGSSQGHCQARDQGRATTVLQGWVIYPIRLTGVQKDHDCDG